MAERAAQREQEDFRYFLYFFDERSGKADDCGTIKYYPHEIIMSRRKGRKNFAGVGNYNFCYFLYFCGTKKLSVAASMVFVAIRIRGIAYDSKGRGWLPV